MSCDGHAYVAGCFGLETGHLKRVTEDSSICSLFNGYWGSVGRYRGISNEKIAQLLNLTCALKVDQGSRKLPFGHIEKLDEATTQTQW